MKPRGTPFRRALQPAIPRVPGAGKPGQLLTVPRTSGANRRHGQPAPVTKSAVGPPLLFALLLSISFAAALLAGCDPAPLPPELDEARKGTIQALVDEVSLTELMAILEDLNGIRSYLEEEGDPLSFYEDRITQRFEASGYTVTLQPVPLAEPDIDITMDNIIVEKPGSDPSLAPILYTGHWDSISWGPGIDDNATACAAVLEAARILADIECARTIRFILFAFEEDGLLGSYHYIENTEDEIFGIINIDMIGYTAEVQNVLPTPDVFIDFPTCGNFISIFASDLSAEWALSYAYAIETFVPDLPYYMAILDGNLANDPLLWDTLRSDHTPLWERGIPGVFLTDTAELREGHPYHSEDDTIENIDQEFFLKNVRAGLAALCLQAGVGE